MRGSPDPAWRHHIMGTQLFIMPVSNAGARGLVSYQGPVWQRGRAAGSALPPFPGRSQAFGGARRGASTGTRAARAATSAGDRPVSGVRRLAHQLTEQPSSM